MERYTMFLDWKNQYYENDCATESNLQSQCYPYQTANSIFHITQSKKKKKITIGIETHKTPNNQNNLEKRKQLEESAFLNSDYTTKLQSSRQYSAGTSTEIQTNGAKQKAHR